MTPSPDPVCPQCGSPLPDHAPRGLCPKCLFAALAQHTGEEPDSVRLPPPDPAELAPHFPQLEIGECLGRGGMGVVYKARQTSLNRFVALKLLAPEWVGDPGFAARFSREARALAMLSHPNIVTIHDFGQAGGFYYLLMEYVDGVNLREAMQAGRFTPEQALAIVPPVCEALQYAHGHGMVHRDIKPENLLLDKDGRVKIADFGIAKMVGENAVTGFSETQPAGTPHYMAPEQREHRSTDHRADIYSLGVVLYEMLTGERPSEKLEAPSRRVQVDVRIDEIVLRALEKTPELRFQSALEMRTQVETLTSAPVPLGVPASVPAPWRDPGSIAGAPAVPSRMSRMALIGACWAPCFLLIGLGFYRLGNVHVQSGEPVPPSWWQISLRLILLPLGFIAPFGTTILGWMAVSRIRRSAGRIHGLRLAVAEGVFFPLLLLTGLAGWFWNWFLYDVVRGALIDSSSPRSAIGQMLVNHAGGFAVLATCLTMAVSGTLLVRAVWKAVKPPAVPVAPAPASTRRGCGCLLAITGAVLLLALLVMLSTWSWSQRGPAVSARTAVFPSAAHVGRNDHSVLLSHADGTAQYVLYYPGDFSSSSSGTQNRVTNTWTDEGSVTLKNGRSFGYHREALYPDELAVNGTKYDLRQGRVFVLHEDGTMGQLSLPLTVSLAMDPVALGAAIAGKKKL